MNKIFLSLFAGIGGFDLGAYNAGLRFGRHLFSEIDPYAIKVFSSRFPDSEALGDITKIKAEDLPHGEYIIAGGFPCQDISVAGKGAGLAGERSGLWYEYARLIGELRPRYAIMENVGALAFRGLDSVLGSLAALGYDAEWKDIRASDVGAPHRRERLWIVAYPNEKRGNGSGRAWDGRAESANGGSDISDSKGERRGARWEGRPLSDSEGQAEQAYGALADTSSGGLEGRAVSTRPRAKGKGTSDALGSGENLADADLSRWNASRPAESSGRAKESALSRDDSQQRGRNAWWVVEPDVGRVANGIPARVDRLKCLGNSIVPQIAELIFSASAFDEWRPGL